MRQQKRNALFLIYNRKRLRGTQSDWENIKYKEKGNALFLILIAVALFAALSYAVTQSGRSGGGVDKETLRIQAALFIQQSGLIRNEIQRMYALNEVDQIHFNDDAANAAGTIYNPDETTGTGKTVGLFNVAETGLSFQEPNDFVADLTSFSWWYLYNAKLLENGVDIGTSLGDEFIIVFIETLEACQEINKGLYGDSTVGDIAFGGLNTADGIIVMNPGGYTYSGGVSNNWDLPKIPGCAKNGPGTVFYYVEDVKRN